MLSLTTCFLATENKLHFLTADIETSHGTCIQQNTTFLKVCPYL